MARALKPPAEKLETKISRLITTNTSIKDVNGDIMVNNTIFFTYTD